MDKTAVNFPFSHLFPIFAIQIGILREEKLATLSAACGSTPGVGGFIARVQYAEEYCLAAILP